MSRGRERRREPAVWLVLLRFGVLAGVATIRALGADDPGSSGGRRTLLAEAEARPGAAGEAASSSRALRPTRPIRLFNGRDLGGFRTWLVDTRREDPRRVFTVTNGLLRLSGDGLGYLATDLEYRDYRLLVEYRWGSTNRAWGGRIGRARDSGIFLHGTGPDGNSHDGNGAFMAAIECQVMEGAVGDFLLIRGTAADGGLIAPAVTVETAPTGDSEGWPYWEAGGRSRTLRRWGRVNRWGKDRAWRDVFGAPDPSRLERPAGEWNQLECRCAGDRVEVWLNGRRVNAAAAVEPSEGRILVQCEGSEIDFRRIELLPLTP